MLWDYLIQDLLESDGFSQQAGEDLGSGDCTHRSELVQVVVYAFPTV